MSVSVATSNVSVSAESSSIYKSIAFRVIFLCFFHFAPIWLVLRPQAFIQLKEDGAVHSFEVLTSQGQCSLCIHFQCSVASQLELVCSSLAVVVLAELLGDENRV